MALERYVKIVEESGAYGSGTGTLVGVYASGYTDTNDRQIMFEETTDSDVVTVGFGGGLKYSGTLNGVLRPKQIKPILTSIFGTATPLSTPTRTEYTFATPSSTVMEFGEETGSSNTAMKYSGVGIDSFTLKAMSKEFITWTANWIAQSADKVSFAVPTGGSDYVNETPLTWDHASVSIDGGITTLSEASSFEMTIESNLRTDWFVLGSYELNGLSRSKTVDITGTLTFTEDEYDELVRGVFGSTGATTVPTTNAVGSADINALLNTASDTSSVLIDLPVALYQSTEHGVSGRDEITKSISFKATGANNKWTTYG